jgi:hypothetical protein
VDAGTLIDVYAPASRFTFRQAGADGSVAITLDFGNAENSRLFMGLSEQRG